MRKNSLHPPPFDFALTGRTVLVTGANGFIGKAVCDVLPSRNFNVLRVVRRSLDASHSDDIETISMFELNETTDWSSALEGVDSVVHLAARVHMMNDVSVDPLQEFRRINVALTINLAQQAADAGVRRFIFVSSIKVNGEATSDGQPFKPEDIPNPTDPYGISKLEAEQGLFKLAAKTGLEVVIIRPVLVYGPGVKANFLSIMRWAAKGVPLPFGSLENRRSLVAIDNLVDLIAISIDHPAADGQIFLVSDGEDITIKNLLSRISLASGVPARLIPVPVIFLKITGRILGQHKVIQRLASSLEVDITKTVQLLGWEPPISVDEGIRRALASESNELIFSGRVVTIFSKILKRIFDLIAGILVAIVITIPLLLICLAVRITSKGPILYWSDRVGRNNVIFKMPKFRSMRMGTPTVATHLLNNPQEHLTPIGSFLRKSSLDELPQVWSILLGDMSFVGPRPALFNQQELIALRTAQGVHGMKPGLTGWAQVNGRDSLTINEKVKLDYAYLQHQSFCFDIRILWLTFVRVLKQQGVSH